MTSSPRAIVVGWLWILAACTLAAPQFGVNNSLELWSRQGDPEFATYREILEEFGEWGWMAMVVRPQQSVYAPETLRELRALTAELENVRNVRRVISLSNASATNVREGALDYTPLLPEEPWTAEALTRFRGAVEAHPLWRGGIVQPPSDRVTVILIQDSNRFGDRSPTRIELLADVRAVAEGYPGLADFGITGTTALNAELNRSSLRDMGLYYPLAFAIALLFSFLVFRQFPLVVAALAPATCSIAVSSAVMLQSGLLFNAVSVLLPGTLLSISTAAAIHVVRAARPALELVGRERRDALRQALAERIPALGACAITTGLGFLSLCFVRILPVRVLGLFGALGVAVALLASITLLPALLARAPAAATGRLEGAVGRALSRIAARLAHHPGASLLGASLVFACLLAGLSRTVADTNYLEFYSESTQIRRAYQMAGGAGFATSTLDVFLPGLELEDSETIAALSAVEADLEAMPEVVKTVSPRSAIVEVGTAFLGEDFARTGLASATPELLAQLLLVADASGNRELDDLFVPAAPAARLTLFTDHLSGRETGELRTATREALERHGLTGSVTGVPSIWANMDRELVDAQRWSLVGLVLAVALVFAVLTRSGQLTAFALAANALPIGAILGFMGLLEMPLNTATVLVAGIAFGVSIDDTVHFIAAYRRNRLLGRDNASAINGSLRAVGPAMILTTLLLCAAFAGMASSDFVPTVQFGALTAVALVLALLADLIWLPALLHLAPWEPQRAQSDPLPAATGRS